MIRWIIANAIGWSLGLIGGSLLLSWIGGLVGLLLAGGLTGLAVGAAQTYAVGELDRRWLALSILGAMLATLPTFAAGFSLIAGRQIGFTVMGAVFGLCLGWTQSHRLDDDERALAWVLANVVGGSLCGLLTLGVTSLPVFLSLGPLAHGLVTGWIWYRN